MIGDVVLWPSALLKGYGMLPVVQLLKSMMSSDSGEAYGGWQHD